MSPIANKRSFLPYLLIGFLLIALLATILIVGQRQELRKKAEAATVLELIPQTNQVNQGDEINLDVVLRPGINQVTAANITLTYDTSYLDGVSFAAGSLFPSVDAPGIAQSGTANIAVSAPTTQPVTGEGVVGTLKLKARNPTAQTTVVFAAVTSVTAIGETENAISSTRPATVAVTRTINATTDLTFSQGNVNVTKGDQFSIDININTGNNGVTSADLLVNYDPNLLTGVAFIKGSFLPDDLRAGSFENGIARITVVSGYTQKTGSGQLARLTFLAREAGETSLVVSAQSVIKAVGTDENMLRNRGTLPVVVVTGTTAPNPTPAPTPGTGGACIKRAPLAPTNVRTTTTGTREITLTWGESLYATHYSVVYGRQPGRYEYGAHNVGYTTLLVVRGLTPNTTYYFAVTAVNDCVSSGYSVEVSARTSQVATTTLTPSPDAPLPTYEPEADFVPIPPDTDPNSFLTASPVLALPSLTPIYNPPEPSVPPERETSVWSALLTPLVGILLLIAAIFLGLFFIRLRTKPS